MLGRNIFCNLLKRHNVSCNITTIIWQERGQGKLGQFSIQLFNITLSYLGSVGILECVVSVFKGHARRRDVRNHHCATIACGKRNSYNTILGFWLIIRNHFLE